MTQLKTPDLEKFIQMRLDQFREVPDLLKWYLPIGAALLQLVAEDRPLTAEKVAEVLGWPVKEVRQRFDEVIESMGRELDSKGRVRIAFTSPDGVPLPVFTVRWLDTGTTARLPGCASDAMLPVLTTGQRAKI